MSLRTAMFVAALACLTIPGAVSAESGKVARTVLRDFAKCAVKNEPDLAKRAVLNSAVSVHGLQKLADARCVGFWRVHLQANELALDAALADELVKREFKRWPVLDPSRIPPLDWPVPIEVKPGPGVAKIEPAFAKELLEAAASDASVGRLGECVVRVTPSGALAVLNTKVDSQAEHKALKALTMPIASCVKSGETSAFNRTNLRQAIALSYYRLANASRATTQERG